MDTRKAIAQEIGRTRSKLQKMGIDTSGLSFTYRSDENDKEEDNSRELWRAGDEFIKLFTSDLVDITDDLTGTEALALFSIIPFISYETGMFTIGTTNNKRPLNNDDVQRMIKKSDTTVTAIMDKLNSKRIVSRNKVGRSYQYFANPYIFFKGKFINKTLIAMFKNYAENKHRS